MSAVEKARVFRSGRSQTIRIPAAYRFQVEEVYIHHNVATGDLTLSERPLAPPLDAIFAELDAAGAAELVLDRDPSPSPERELL